MRLLASVGLCMGLVMGCSPRTDETAQRDTAAGAAPADTAGMAGMDHSKMDMGTGATADSAVPAAADPARVPGGRQPAAQTAPVDPMAGMDHSKMAMPSPAPATTPGAARTANPGPAGRSTASSGATAMAGMDHSKMGMGSTAPAPRAPTARAGEMAGMDHSRMTPGPGTPRGSAATPRVTPGDEKLQRLVAALLQDSVVRQRVQADTALRRQWADTTLRRVLINPP